MIISLDKYDISGYLSSQLNTFFPDKRKVKKRDILSHLDLILERTEFCFSMINNKYFLNDGNVVFSHLHADQYAMFLYFAASTLYRNKADLDLCSKIFHLNRYLHGIDVFYEVNLPDIFLFVHPLGTVLGRGTYSNYFAVYQRCGVGSNHDVYPVLKEYVTLHPGSSVIGNCLVEENCTIAAGSLLLDKNLEKNSVYIGNPKNYFVKKVEAKLPIWRN